MWDFCLQNNLSQATQVNTIAWEIFNTKSLGMCQNLTSGVLEMLHDQRLCDVTFIVGVVKEEVKAHKVLLASGSDVFYVMFCGALAGCGGTIEIPDIEPDVLMDLFRYIYAGDCNITNENVAYLTYAAKKYAVDELYAECIQHLESTINHENALHILQTAHILDEKTLLHSCLAYVYSHGEEVLKTIGLINPSPYDCRLLFRPSMVNVDKDQTYVQTLLKLRSDVDTLNNKLHHNTRNAGLIQNILYLVRFPFIGVSVISRMLYNADVLKEIDDDLYLEEIKLNERIRDTFISEFVRHSEPVLLQRLGDPAFQEMGRFCTLNATLEERLTFSCSKNLTLIGLNLYRPVTEGRCDVSVVIQENNAPQIRSVKTQLFYKNKETRDADVYFLNPVPISIRTTYTLTMICTGPETYLGIRPKPAVGHKDELVVCFTDESCSIDNTVVTKGMVRGFIVHI